ncbi:hypothetical protein BDN72DRAFT_936663 [Pluteus cervinus]|uniref:Uncharacterized protein n=1 Tax=Pluteus cervinus TaxID=181527 RepID=A0ACD3AZV8_9AGAR|nr:hypothetical protein BDN72DRAFT_936663 [Pluteus cervinus]
MSNATTSKAINAQPQAVVAMNVMNPTSSNPNAQQTEEGHKHRTFRFRGAGAGKRHEPLGLLLGLDWMLLVLWAAVTALAISSAAHVKCAAKCSHNPGSSWRMPARSVSYHIVSNLRDGIGGKASLGL